MPSQMLRCRAIFDKTVVILPLPEFACPNGVKEKSVRDMVEKLTHGLIELVVVPRGKEM